jgi:hypothetical protein
MVHFLIFGSALLPALPDDAPTAAVRLYEAMAEKAGRDPGAHVRLASWCELRGLQIERHKQLTIALEIDLRPAHARSALSITLCFTSMITHGRRRVPA